MSVLVGIRFRRAGRVYYFDPAELELNIGDHVVVETTRGMEVGRVAIAPQEMPADDVSKPLKPVARMAEPDEIDHVAQYEQMESEAMEECARLVKELGLQMKLLAAEYSLDGRHLTFFFSASERVDFRQLVRELAGRFKVRVELRQVGARDEAKLVGGYGRCGRELCCCSFLSEFAPISIRMAKEQNLPLNPMKISGVCGRLLCCLSYENQQYHDAKAGMPKPRQLVYTQMGAGQVVSTDPLREMVQVAIEGRPMVTVPLGEISLDGPVAPPPAAVEELRPSEAPVGQGGATSGSVESGGETPGHGGRRRRRRRRR